MGWRRRAFYLVLLAEIVLLAALLAPSSGRGGGATYGAVYAFHVLVWAALGVGLLNALVASLPKPRWRVAVVMLVLHAVAIAWQVVVWGPGRVSDREAERDERTDEAAKQARWAKELAALIVAKRYPEAIAYIDAHNFLVLDDGEPFRKALCPDDGSTPSYPLLLKLGERGAPSGGEHLVEAARCSDRAFRAVMAVGHYRATDTGDGGRTALMTATDPTLLSFLIVQGVDVNARDARGRTALMFHRSADVTRFLLVHGGDPKAVAELGYSALHFSGPLDELGPIFELLLEAGADPNQEADTGAPMHTKVRPLRAMACYKNQKGLPFDGLQWSQSAANALVKYGASPEDRLTAIRCSMLNGDPIADSLRWPELDLSGPGGAGLLVRAASGEHKYITELLEAGVNPLAKNKDGELGLKVYEEHMRPLPGDEVYARLLEAAHRLPLHDAGP